MKLVEFTRDMLPQRAGETRVVPDEVADKLVKAGEAVVKPSVYDTRVIAPAPPKRYLTRAVGLLK